MATRKNTPEASDRLRSLYRTMTLVRQVEQALSKLFADGEVPGFIHLSIGQEAIDRCGSLDPSRTSIFHRLGETEAGHPIRDETGFSRVGSACRPNRTFVPSTARANPATNIVDWQMLWS